MNPKMARALEEELSSIIKEAGFVSNLGTGLASVGKRLASSAKNRAAGMGMNALDTAAAFTTPIKSFKRGWSDPSEVGWMGKGKVLKYLPIGSRTLTAVGAVTSFPGAIASEDIEGKGRGRAERMAGWVGNQTGGIIGSPFGITGAIGGGIVGDRIGARIGRNIDRAVGNISERRKKKLDKEPTPANGIRGKLYNAIDTAKKKVTE